MQGFLLRAQLYRPRSGHVHGLWSSVFGSVCFCLLCSLVFLVYSEWRLSVHFKRAQTLPATGVGARRHGIYTIWLLSLSEIKGRLKLVTTLTSHFSQSTALLISVSFKRPCFNSTDYAHLSPGSRDVTHTLSNTPFPHSHSASVTELLPDPFLSPTPHRCLWSRNWFIVEHMISHADFPFIHTDKEQQSQREKGWKQRRLWQIIKGVWCKKIPSLS